MSKTLIKICGIKQPEMATLAATTGADFIGIVFAANSKRRVDVTAAVAIAASARAAGAEPVAVFTDTDAHDMLDICRQINCQYVQLHDDKTREQQALLPSSLQRIYACRVYENGDIHQADLLGIKTLDTTRDYLLFDGMHAGSGQAFAWHDFHYTGEFRWFLSGGLSINTVARAIRQLRPTGVDVSSGVENSHGEKDSGLIKKFITTCSVA